MTNQFDKTFEIHSSENFTANSIYELFSEIVSDHNLKIDQDVNGILNAESGLGKLSFKQFTEHSWLRWVPNGP